MDIVKTPFKEIIVIKQLISMHYFEFSKDFVFQGEKHDFWEFLYVVKGEADVTADAKPIVLKQGDIIFHKPNEFHTISANKLIAPNIIVVAFECKSKEMAFFKNKVFSLDETQRHILAQILQLSFVVFEPPFNDPKKYKLKKRNDDQASGSEQLIKINLELLMIDLIRKGHSLPDEQPSATTATKSSEDDLVKQMCLYMEENVTNHLTLEQISDKFNFSKSHALILFKKKTGTSIVKYYNTLVIEKAKQMIREKNYNFTQISEILNYSSIYNFSRQFKAVTGMTPSEYAKTITAKML